MQQFFLLQLTSLFLLKTRPISKYLGICANERKFSLAKSIKAGKRLGLNKENSFLMDFQFG